MQPAARQPTREHRLDGWRRVIAQDCVRAQGYEQHLFLRYASCPSRRQVVRRAAYRFLAPTSCQ
eukprot:9919033-Lingulodinium_polyedra.AAC.1